MEGGGQWSVAGTTSPLAVALALAEVSSSRAVVLPGLLLLFARLLRCGGRTMGAVPRLIGLSVSFPEGFEAECQCGGVWGVFVYTHVTAVDWTQKKVAASDMGVGGSMFVLKQSTLYFQDRRILNGYPRHELNYCRTSVTHGAGMPFLCATSW